VKSASHQKLPVTHPEYRYPVSRNPYWKKLRELPGPVAYSDNDAEAHRGEWRGLFLDGKPARGRKLHVEIGCNGGHVSLEWAARDPDGAYVGLDWKMKQIHRGAEKVLQRKLGNLIFLRAHAERLPFIFSEEEIDALYLYFPDPWPKKSQQKNRFINPRNLEMLARVVRSGGTFHIKTDHPGYFEWMEQSLAEAAAFWDVEHRSTDLHKGHPDPKSLRIPEVTLFERIFVEKGLPIHSLKLRRR
jgi:tRNA (guanine-N7-)-methyltransferase